MTFGYLRGCFVVLIGAWLMVSPAKGVDSAGGGEPADPFRYEIPVKNYSVIDLSGDVQGQKDVREVAIGNDGQAAFCYWESNATLKVALWKDGSLLSGSPKKTGTTMKLFPGSEEEYTIVLTENDHPLVLNSRGSVAIQGFPSGAYAWPVVGSWAFGDSSTRNYNISGILYTLYRVTESDKVIAEDNGDSGVLYSLPVGFDSSSAPSGSALTELSTSRGGILARIYYPDGDPTFTISADTGQNWHDVDLSNLSNPWLISYSTTTLNDSQHIFIFDYLNLTEGSTPYYYNGSQVLPLTSLLTQKYSQQTKEVAGWGAQLWNDGKAFTEGLSLEGPGKGEWVWRTFIMDTADTTTEPDGKWPLTIAQFPDAWNIGSNSIRDANSSGLMVALAKKIKNPDGSPIPASQQHLHAALLVPVKITTSSPPYSDDASEVGPVNNILSAWPGDYIRLYVNLDGLDEDATLPPHFIKWEVPDSGAPIPDNQRRAPIAWSTPGIRQVVITVGGQKFRVVIDNPDVGLATQELVAMAYPAEAFLANAYALQAQSWAAEALPDDSDVTDTLRTNALRHSYWNALMASNPLIGPALAIQFSTAHEFNNWSVDHGDAFDTTMDLHNNLIGSLEVHTNSYGLPDEIPIHIGLLTRLRNGDLWIVPHEFATSESGHDSGHVIKSNWKKVFPLE